jgi:hypothetical protein
MACYKERNIISHKHHAILYIQSYGNKAIQKNSYGDKVCIVQKI